MWCLWIKEGNHWTQSTKVFVEEMEARKVAIYIKALFSLNQVFIQFSDDFPIEIM